MLVWLLTMLLTMWSPHQGAYAEARPLAAQEVLAETQTASSPPHKQPENAVLRDKTVLQSAQNSLMQEPDLQGQSIEVFQKIDFFDGDRPRIELAVRNPKQPESLIFFTYEQGKWTRSEAEDISHIKDLSRHLFALNEVNFAQAADIAAVWQQKADEVNAVVREPYHVMLVWLPKPRKLFWHTATLEAVGKQFYLSCHHDGSVWEWKQLAGSHAEEQ